MDVFTVSLIVLLVLSIVLWVWAVYDLRKSRIATNSKLVWLVVLLFLPMIGPMVYFQMIKKQKYA